MKIVTYEATVENGQIRLLETVHLPEHTKVFVVVPGVEVLPILYLPVQWVPASREVQWRRMNVRPCSTTRRICATTCT